MQNNFFGLLNFFFKTKNNSSTLVPTIHTFFWKSASQQSQSDEIEAILADKEAIEDFKAFSAKEFSLENIVFYGTWNANYLLLILIFF